LHAPITQLTRAKRACYTLDMLGRENLDEALRTLGAVLEARGLTSGILVAGGSSLLLLGFIDRPTADLDVIGLTSAESYVKAEQIPAPLAEAVRDVAAALGLSETWLNNGPAALFDLGLPKGYETRITVQRYGGLEVHIAGRYDQLCFKLYAAADHSWDPASKHFADLEDMEPTAEELLAAARWTRTHDPSEGFLAELTQTLARLGVEATDADLA
jgi:hypothetical protein